jgi:hypothetical protein
MDFSLVSQKLGRRMRCLSCLIGFLFGLFGFVTFEMLSNPDLDEGLSRHTKTTSLTIKTINHPHREIHIDPFLFLAGPERFREIQIVIDVDFPIIENFI